MAARPSPFSRACLPSSLAQSGSGGRRPRRAWTRCSPGEELGSGSLWSRCRSEACRMPRRLDVRGGWRSTRRRCRWGRCARARSPEVRTEVLDAPSGVVSSRAKSLPVSALNLSRWVSRCGLAPAVTSHSAGNTGRPSGSLPKAPVGVDSVATTTRNWATTIASAWSGHTLLAGAYPPDARAYIRRKPQRLIRYTTNGSETL